MFSRNINSFFICGVCEKELRGFFPDAVLPFNEQSKREGGRIVANWINLAIHPPKLLVCDYCDAHINNGADSDRADYQAMETMH